MIFERSCIKNKRTIKLIGPFLLKKKNYFITGNISFEGRESLSYSLRNILQYLLIGTVLISVITYIKLMSS